MLLWKAADQRAPLEEARNIANFGWNIEGSAITPAVSTAPIAPQAVLDVVAVAALQSARHAVAHAAATTEHCFLARTTANAREKTSAVVLSSASSWISNTMKGSQVSMMNKYTQYKIYPYKEVLHDLLCLRDQRLKICRNTRWPRPPS